MMMAVRITRRRQAIISGAVSPIFREMIRCYCANLNVEMVDVAAGVTDSAQDKIIEKISEIMIISDGYVCWGLNYFYEIQPFMNRNWFPICWNRGLM